MNDDRFSESVATIDKRQSCLEIFARIEQLQLKFLVYFSLSVEIWNPSSVKFHYFYIYIRHQTVVDIFTADIEY